MRINSIQAKEANITISSDELVLLNNLMYFYEKNLKTIEPDHRDPNPLFHETYAQVLTAKDLTQYGHVDSFTLRHIVIHKLKANPDCDLKRLGINMKEKGDED